MTPFGSNFTDYATYSSSNNRVILGDSSTKLKILGKGNIHRWVVTAPGKHRELLLKNVLHVKGLKRRFLSTSHFTNAGFHVAFSSNNVAITKGKFCVSGVQSSPLFVETELEALGSSNWITGHALSSTGTRSGVTIVL